MTLLTTHNAKTIKGEKRGYLTGILYLAPGKTADSKHNVCPYATKGCSRVCLYTAGRGRFTRVQEARIRKTRLLFSDRQKFIDQLRKDIKELQRLAVRRGLIPVIRLNGTSDLPWESKAFGSIPQSFPDLVFYDYSKSVRRMNQVQPPNYTLVFSRSENNERSCRQLLSNGYAVAVVFDKVVPGSVYLGYSVVDGDADDLRFLDRRPCIVGLKVKGDARKDKSRFVVKTEEQ